MTLTLKRLQTLAKQTLDETNALDRLRRDVRSAFGPSVIVEGTVLDIADNVNECLDTARVLKRPLNVELKVSTLATYVKHKDASVRKMVASLIPERFLVRMKDDSDAVVRAAVAKRICIGTLFEMCKKYPHDDQLSIIRKQRVISESVDLDNFDKAEKLSKASQNTITIELSDAWYEEVARKIMNDYGEFSYGTPRPLETHWNPLAVRMYCDSMKTTSGVVIDRDKLQKTVDDYIANLEESDPVYHGTMTDMIKGLKEAVRLENKFTNTSVFEIVEEDTRPEVKLASTLNISTIEYIKLFEETYKVAKTEIPAAIRKYRLGEEFAVETKIPMKAIVGQLNEFKERALDRYVECWNKNQSLHGEPLKIDWSVDPMNENKISFEMELM